MFWRKDGKFVASKPRDDILRIHGCLERFGKFYEHAVPFHVAICIVDTLEIIQVHNKKKTFAMRSQAGIDQFRNSLTVPQSRQRIPLRHGDHFLLPFNDLCHLLQLLFQILFHILKFQ